MKKPISFVALLLAATVALGIFGQAPGPEAQAQQQPKKAVAIRGFNFSPAKVTVIKGTKVTWTNKDRTAHTVTASNGTFGSGTLGTGEKFSRTFRKVGKVAYHCGIHPTMKGTVIVKRPTN